MLEVTRQATSEEYTRTLARGVAGVLRPGDVILLAGDLGAGKTTFVRGLAEGLGLGPSVVSSPTFVMINQYPLTRPEGVELVHVDAYRLNSADDLDTLGWDRFIDPGTATVRATCILAVEWPERIAASLPPQDACAKISLTAVDAATRLLVVQLPDSWRARLGVEHLLEREPARCRVTGDWVEPTGAAYPFSSNKARMADLNRWFRGDYLVSRPLEQRDLEEGAPD